MTLPSVLLIFFPFARQPWMSKRFGVLTRRIPASPASVDGMKSRNIFADDMRYFCVVPPLSYFMIRKITETEM